MENGNESKSGPFETLRQNAGVIIMLLVAVAAFALAYSQFTQNAPEKETTLNGVKVIAKGSVKTGLAEIFSPQVIATQVVLDGEDDGRPCKVPMQTEAIYALAKSGKNVSFQLAVRGQNYCLQSAGGNQSARVDCAKPRLVVENSECNCVKLYSKNQTVVISGREDWLCATAPNVREIIAWGLKKE